MVDNEVTWKVHINGLVGEGSSDAVFISEFDFDGAGEMDRTDLENTFELRSWDRYQGIHSEIYL